jgi:hypothetical protein
MVKMLECGAFLQQVVILITLERVLAATGVESIDSKLKFN